MKLAITLASAIAIHAAAAVGASALGVAHGVALVPATQTHADETIDIESARTEAHDELPVTKVESVAKQSSRGTPNPVNVLARQSTSAPANASDVVPMPPPTSLPESTHFKMTVSTNAGTSHGAANAPPAIAAEDEVVTDDAVTTRAQKIGGAEPTYPQQAIAQGVELGSPLPFEIIVDTAGHVTSVRPLHRAGYGFDEAAVAALHTFRFSPATRNGHAVNVRMRWTVEFRFN